MVAFGLFEKAVSLMAVKESCLFSLSFIKSAKNARSIRFGALDYGGPIYLSAARKSTAAVFERGRLDRYDTK